MYNPKQETEMKRSVKIFLLIGLVHFILFGLSEVRAQKDIVDKKLVILFTHDLHSYLMPFQTSTREGGRIMRGGYARIAHLIAQEQALHKGKTLLVDAGDISMGTLFHTSFATEASELRLMGKMGYEALTFGNHDFDFHSEGLAKMLRVAKLSNEKLPLILASNIAFKSNSPTRSSLEQTFREFPVKEYGLINKNGLRIGVFGLMGRDAAEEIAFAKDLTFTELVPTARRIVDILKNKEKVDVILCLSHSGTSKTKKRSEDEILAREVPQIDIIISGHTHTVLPKPIISGKTLIVSAGCYGAHLGILEVDFSKGAGGQLLSYRLQEVTDELPEDRALAEDIEKYRKKLNQTYLSSYQLKFDQVLAEGGFNLESLEQAYARPGEMGLGNLITDAFREAVKKAEGSRYEHIHMVLQPLGMIRDSLGTGKITVNDVFRVLSLGLGLDGSAGYPLVTFYLTGKEIKNALEVESTLTPIKPNYHLQVSGIRFQYNPHRLPFDRVNVLTVQESDGKFQPPDPKRLYRVCVNYNVAAALNLITRKTYGILKITPKDKQGQPLGDIKTAILDGDPQTPGVQEIKEWFALATYLKSFPDTDGNGLPNIPYRYHAPEGRFSSNPSWNPIALIKSGNYLTYGTLGVGILILCFLIFIALWIIRRLRKGRKI